MLRSIALSALLLSSLALSGQTRPSRAAELEKYKELQNPEKVKPSTPIVLYPTILREVATPQIEGEIKKWDAVLKAKQDVVKIAGKAVHDQAVVVETRKAEWESAKERTALARDALDYAKQHQQLMQFGVDIGLGESAVSAAEKAVHDAEAKESASFAEWKAQQSVLKSLQNDLDAANSAVKETQQKDDDARAERAKWLEQQLKENPAAVGTLVEPYTVMVRFKSTATTSDIDHILDKYKLETRSGIASIALFITEIAHPDGPPAAGAAEHLNSVIHDLLAEPAVLTAYPNVLLRAPSVPVSDQTRPECNWFNGSGTAAARMLNLPSAWNFCTAIEKKGDRAVDVLILDNGFAQHSDLSFENVCEAVVAEHGTEVTGIIGALHDGHGIDGYTPFAHLLTCAPSAIPPVPGSKLVGALSSWFTELLKDFDTILAKRHPKVVNASLGYNWGHDLAKCPDDDKDIKLIVAGQGDSFRAVIDQHADRLFVVASAAGNDRREEDPCGRDSKWTSPFNWAALAPQFEDPDNLPPSANVFVVEAATAQKLRSSFSNDGNIRAPGEAILTTVANANLYDVSEGTSMAAPAITSIVALMFAYNPNLTLQQIRSILGIDISKPQVPDAFQALAACRPAPEVARDLADLNGDGKVTIEDFEIFKRALAAIENNNFTEDLNGDGVVDANEAQFCRADFNGDGIISRNVTSIMKTPANVTAPSDATDLGFMKRAWEDPNVKASELDDRLKPAVTMAVKPAGQK